MAQPIPHYPWAPEVSVGSVDEVVELSLEGSRYSHPQEVLTDPSLSTTEKRAVLASWASDVWAVEGMPAYRELPGSGRVVSVDDVLDALRALDTAELH